MNNQSPAGNPRADSSPPASPSATGWTTADTALWLYFFLPVVIFLPGFFLPVLGIPVAILAVAAAAYWLPSRTAQAVKTSGDRRRNLVVIGALAALAGSWAVLGGAGHVFHANPVDWVPRFAVLRDLVVQEWPPRYIDGRGAELVLRAPLGYYLPTALIAHAHGLAWADSILLLWTWLGVALFFAANFPGTGAQRLIGAALFVFASGLDVIGVWAKTGTLPWAAQHLEWWAGSLQYSSNSTLLFWVPNHAFAGWISAAWLWRFRGNPRFLVRLPILFLPVMLWSPLPAVGLLPLATVAVAMHWRECFLSRERRAELLNSLGLVLAPAGLVAAYLLMNAESIPMGSSDVLQAQAGAGKEFRIADTLLFFFSEAGILGVIALLRERSSLIVASIAVLAILPWLHFGPNNDLLMRGSIPALTILWFVLIAELTAEPGKCRLSSPMRLVLVCLFALGMVTPFQEMYRALSSRPWSPDLKLHAPSGLGGFPPHYFAPTKDAWLKPLFRNSLRAYAHGTERYPQKMNRPKTK